MTLKKETAANPDRATFVRTFWVLVFAAVSMAFLLALLPAAGHDQLWFLLMAQRWLGGAQLYGPEIFDSNPPLVVWLSAAPVAVAHALHLPTTVVAKLLVALVAAASAALSLFFLKRARPTRSYELPALLFAFVVIFAVVPARDFGQRDHLTAVLILPYVLAAASAERYTLLRVLAGVFAAVAICLKPHHALIPITLELALLYLARRDRQGPSASSTGSRQVPTLLRPEPICIALLGVAFVAAIHRFAPLYFSEALPILRATYWAIGHLTLPQLALEAIELLILAAISLALSARFRPANPTVPLLQLAGFAAMLAYFAQGTGWYYQQLPAISLFACALVLQLLDLFAARSPLLPAWLPKAAAALTIIALALTTELGAPQSALSLPKGLDFEMWDFNVDTAFFAGLSPGTPVAILTTSVDDAMMPVERYPRRWAQRTNNLWLLPAILRSESPGAHMRLTPTAVAALDELQHRWMVADLARWRPQLILIQRCQDPAVHCQELEDRHDDLLAWFNRDLDFQALFRQYAFTGTRGEFDSYTLLAAPRN